jgi:copper transport protein
MSGLRHAAARAALVMGCAVLVVVAGATPAFAHAELESTDPQAGGVYDDAPSEVTLQYTEPVEASLGAVRLYDGRGDRLDTGAPSHPGGDGSAVRVDLPELRDGSYVVTWRVVSADSHPVRGAFTFQVGPEATADDLEGLTQRLLASEGGDETVGAVAAVARFGVFASLALLVGGAAFVVIVWRAGRTSPRAAVLVWVGWVGAVLATAVQLLVQGPYAAALGLGDALDLDLLREVLDTRAGRVWAARLVLLLVAFVLVRRLFPGGRRPAREYPLSPVWAFTGAAIGTALVATPGLGGHAGSGDLVPLAVVADTAHLGAVALWLGGLVVLFVAFLPGADAEILRTTLPRYSQLALASVGVIVVTGVFQSWRQVGSLSALRDTDFGRLLVIKLLLVGVILVAAAFSREVVNRTFRARRERVAVGAGGPPVEMAALDDPDEFEEPLDDETEVRNLRRSVFVEVAIAGAVLVVTALLVNTPPGRTAEDPGPFATVVKTEEAWFDILVSPAQVGTNDVHVTALTTTGASTEILEMEVTLSQPDRDIAPIDLPLSLLGPGHFVADDVQVPIAGDWLLTASVLVDDTTQVTGETEVSIR